MAGRGGRGGRGRGRGISFNIDSLGFGRGENLPAPILQPSPLFPPLEYKAVPLATGEEFDYLLALKQEFCGAMRESPYYIKPDEKKRDIERYSDKYQLVQQDETSWQPDWTKLPSELKIKKVKKSAKLKAVIKPNLSASSKKIKGKTEDISKTLEELEKKENVESDEDEEKQKEGAEAEEEDDYYDEEDMEEETDYILNYFDNGENFGADEDDDLDDGPIY